MMYSRKAVGFLNRNTDRAFLRPVFFYARVFTHGQKTERFSRHRHFFRQNKNLFEKWD